MKPIALLVSLTLIALPVVAETPEAGLATLQELGQLNGQALACSQMGLSGKAKALMIKHSPKTRRYGEVFEEATHAAFLEQGKNADSCPIAHDFAGRLSALATRLQATLPAVQ
jgi:hypothetical protein